MYEYKATVTKIYDGDTVTVDIDLGLGLVMHKQVIRLYGINTPEIRGAQKRLGKTSRQALMDRILESPNSEIVLKTYKDKKGKFGRWLGEIFIGGENINQWLVLNGYAKEYLP